LAIFSGRFTSQAAAEIIGPVNLKGLVRKSLLQEETGEGGRTRFQMLQVLADFALERLQAKKALLALQQNHAAYYLKLAETAEPHLTGPDPTDWFEQLEEAHDNFRAVLHRSLKDSAFEQALGLCSILWRLWAVYSYLSEGGLWLHETLAATADLRNIQRAKTLYGAGRIALFQQNMPQASQSFNESLLIYRDLGCESGQATVLNSLGEIGIQQSDYERASRLFEEAQSLFRANEDRSGIVQTLTNLAHLALHQAQYDRANELLLESLKLEEEMGRPEATAIVLNGLGEVALIQGRIMEAAAYYERALEIYRQLNYNIGQAVMLHNLGQLNLVQEQFQTAVSFFRESLKLLRTMEEKVIVAWNLAGLGSAILNLGNTRHAVWLFSVTQTLLAVQGGRLDVLDEPIYNRYLAKSKERLSEAEWQQAWLEGQTMPVENELLDIISLTPALPQNPQNL
jgi:tetratricopeptide (TPR) repeat protein